MKISRIRRLGAANTDHRNSRNRHRRYARFGIILATLFVGMSAADSQKTTPAPDARNKSGFNFNIGYDFGGPELLDESELFDKIASLKNDDLLKALGRDRPAEAYHRSLRLKWGQRVALRDADYFLYLFDSPGHAEPGDNPRVLTLFNLGYELKTWGRFTCAPFFASGYIINRLHRPETYFVTVNPSGRFGGELWFEKYVIAPGEILKLGEDYALNKIPELPQEPAPDHDNRIKPGFKVGDVIPDDGKLLDESMLFDKIASFQNDELLRALGRDFRDFPGQGYMRLKWQQRITLHDADYILCLFDSTVRIEPGQNPRVLILFNLGYELKTWGRFICEPGFDSGHILQPIGRPETYFQTVNVSGRFGGSLSFEKYLITPSDIRRLESDH